MNFLTWSGVVDLIILSTNGKPGILFLRCSDALSIETTFTDREGYVFRYFDRADGNIKIPGTNWTVFWYGPKGLGLIRDYIHICRDIPASFLPPKPKNP